ncbi:hypothetical protein LCGC14_0728990 [marine sediment metagenome]|uniref:HNH nuclease domain-containing protein n=1 Tax=marine sediment metagenome TaxID=412755 RepID=A0A0F9QV79_9ZZZZ
MIKMKNIIGYTNYLIDECGNIFNSKLHKRLRGTIDKKGYRRVCLTKNGEEKTHLIHRLVAKTYISNPLNKPQVNHIDKNPLNNCIKNLEWVTDIENKQHNIRLKMLQSEY